MLLQNATPNDKGQRGGLRKTAPEQIRGPGGVWNLACNICSRASVILFGFPFQALMCYHDTTGVFGPIAMKWKQ